MPVQPQSLHLANPFCAPTLLQTQHPLTESIKSFFKIDHLSEHNLSNKSNLKEAARNLYKTLRLIKKKNYKMICVSSIPKTGIGIAINDRLNRAAK